MATFLSYLLQSSLLLVLFYLLYKWIYSKETFYRLNRFLLLFLLSSALVLPLMPWEYLFTQPAGSHVPFIAEALLTVNLQDLVVVPRADLDWIPVFVGFYLLGFGIAFLLQMKEVGKLLLFLKRGEVIDATNEFKLIIHNDKNQAPFSWMRNIVLSKQDYKECGEEILLHEKAHILYKHSWDLLFIHWILLFQWFNPVVWLLKQELEMVHEYQADAYVLKKGVNAQKYQLVLIKRSVGDYMFNLANSFNHGHLRKRIEMMLVKKSSRWARLKMVYLLPVLFVVAFVLGCSQSENSSTSQESVGLNEVVVVGYGVQKKVNLSGAVGTMSTESINQEDDKVSIRYHVEKDNEEQKLKGEVFDVVETMPEFPGGLKALMQYLGENIKYPKTAIDSQKEGRVIVSFVINKEGDLMNAKIVRSIDSALDEEALRVVNSMPKWKPGEQGGKKVNVKYTLPVAFRLE